MKNEINDLYGKYKDGKIGRRRFMKKLSLYSPPRGTYFLRSFVIITIEFNNTVVGITARAIFQFS